MFNKIRPGSRTIFITIDLSKPFDSVWHPADLFYKLISTSLSFCFAGWTQFFLFNWRACVVYQNHKSCFFQARQGVPQGSVLGPGFFFFSSIISLLLCLFPSVVLFMLTTWQFVVPPVWSLMRWRPYKEL